MIVETIQARARTRRGVLAAIAIATIALLMLAMATQARAAGTPPPPSKDPFYTYRGAKPLKDIAPGTVLKTRTTTYSLAGVPTPITVVQLLYRSTNAINQPVTNVTSVLLPPTPSATPHLVAYGSFYDSLSTTDEPSYTFASGTPTSESAFIAPLLLEGDTVSVADTEGQQTDFAVGPEYGLMTLDGLRAALNSPATSLPNTDATQIALIGYSGGAIATEWAAQMAPTYAPDISDRLVGASMGGVYVEPAHNVDYVSGSTDWGGVIPMALIGAAKAYHKSFTPFLSAYGKQVFAAVKHENIDQATAAYPGLTFQSLVKAKYADPESIPPFVNVVNKLIMGYSALPTVPLYIAQGADGTLDGTNGDQPGIGPGDGVMITGDVRTYASEVCASGQPVDYNEYDSLDHTSTAVPWIEGTLAWLAERFGGVTAPSDCSSIPAGNPLGPVTVQPAG